MRGETSERDSPRDWRLSSTLSEERQRCCRYLWKGPPDSLSFTMHNIIWSPSIDCCCNAFWRLSFKSNSNSLQNITPRHVKRSVISKYHRTRRERLKWALYLRLKKRKVFKTCPGRIYGKLRKQFPGTQRYRTTTVDFRSLFLYLFICLFFISFDTVISPNCLYELPLVLMKNVKTLHISFSERKLNLSGDVETNPGLKLTSRPLQSYSGTITNILKIST